MTASRERARSWSRLLARWRNGPLGRVVVRFVAIGGYDRGLALATQAFVAVVPLLIVVAAAVPERSRTALAAGLIGDLSLSGSSADQLRELVGRPPDVTEPITVIGAALLVVSVLGFTRSLQRTHLAAWGLPGAGLRGLGDGLLGAAALVTEIGLLLLLAPLLDGVPNVVLLTALLRTVPAVLAWWVVQRLVLGGRVSWGALLPGAVFAGLGQTVVMTVAALHLDDQLASQAARYGLIGVAFVLVGWLVVLGFVLVLGAVVGAESGGAAPVQPVGSAPPALT